MSPIGNAWAESSSGAAASNPGPTLDITISADFMGGELVPTAVDDIVYIQGTAHDPHGVRAYAVYIGGQLEKFEEINAPQTDASFSTAVDVSHLAPGEHELTVYVVDNNRDVMGYSAHRRERFHILRDTNPTCAQPTVSLVSPVAGSEVSGLVTLSAQASSPDSTIDWVDFRVDGVDVFRSTGPGPHSWDWDTAGLSGSHQLMAIAHTSCGSQKASAVVDVTVFNGPNQAPVAADDHAVVRCGEAKVLPVTVNDDDPDGDEVVLVGAASLLPVPPTAGTVTKVSATSLRYEPASGCDEGGSDSFTYRVGDGRGLRDTAQVTVDILPRSAPPVAEADGGYVVLGQSLVMNLTANDHDPDGGTPTLVAQANLLPTPPTLGTVTRLNGQEIRYTPSAAGTDTFEYQIGDLQGRRATGTVTVEVGLPEVTVPVAEDAYVNQRPGFESTNAGGAQILRVRTAQGLGLHSYLKFHVSGVTGTVRSARLRVKTDASPIGSMGVWTVPDSSWTEAGIIWLTAPTFGAQLITETGFLAAATWHEIDVTSAIQGDGTYTLVLATALDMGALTLASRESGQVPELIVTYEP